MDITSTDIQENDILALSPDLLLTLLKDNTLSKHHEQVNIFWATDNYADRGPGYAYTDQITVEAITGSNGNVIVPRSVKSREQQQQRSREMAEVFTPSWICNKQNNLVDTAWFGRNNVFNTEVDGPDGTHHWIPSEGKIAFPEGKTWNDYIADTRMEITCGEAPYLVSRYDTVSGAEISIDQRIGMLDRKLRVVSENTSTPADWLKAAKIAFQSIYGYEWQGDNLLLAREALLFTFIEYYAAKFGTPPQLDSLNEIAEIISWNIWQMDGLKGVIPNSCKSSHTELLNLEGEVVQVITQQCEGCRKNDISLHNGTHAIIRDWTAPENKQTMRFISLIKQ